MTLRDPKEAVDVIGYVAAIGVMADLVPIIVGLLSAVWFAIRIYEWARVALFNKPPRPLD